MISTGRGGVSNFAQTPAGNERTLRSSHHLKAAPCRKSVKWRGAMNDARRYRVNAADCLLAAKTCQPGYHAIILSVSACWHSLAIEEEAIDLLRALEVSPTRMISASREPQ
jgi:hypothetical protein